MKIAPHWQGSQEHMPLVEELAPAARAAKNGIKQHCTDSDSLSTGIKNKGLALTQTP
jgi:hypothetical protein